MTKHYVGWSGLTRSNTKQKIRWWQSVCAPWRLWVMSKDHWSMPDSMTRHKRQVTCEACLEKMGLELLFDLKQRER